MGPIQTLDECINIFENGPTGRSLCDSLALLNDEEIILLSQNGKVAAYALEKVLGPAELERAVRIRRALICRFFFPFSFSLDFNYLLQLALHVLKL
jgi:hydroxymethylglutaryl-CoA reductase (NADPH)